MSLLKLSLEFRQAWGIIFRKPVPLPQVVCSSSPVFTLGNESRCGYGKAMVDWLCMYGQSLAGAVYHRKDEKVATDQAI